MTLPGPGPVPASTASAHPLGSPLGLGTHSLHRLLSSTARRRLLDLAYEHGIRYFDTAPSYGAGLAERELGAFARVHRASIVLATKFGIPPARGVSKLPGGAYWAAMAGLAARALRGRGRGPRAPHRDYGPDRLRPSVESSLRALRSDHIDILYLHEPAPDSIADADRLVSALEALRKAGKVRMIGLSGHESHCLTIARRYPALGQVLQIEAPADPKGLPDGTPLAAEVAVGFWEFPPAAPGLPPWPLEVVLERLRSAVPPGATILLSTRHAEVVREACELAGRPGAALSRRLAPRFSSERPGSD